MGLIDSLQRLPYPVRAIIAVILIIVVLALVVNHLDTIIVASGVVFIAYILWFVASETGVMRETP